MAIDFEPSNVVRILYNVPLDNTYRNTIDFASAGPSKLQRLSAQQTYFMGMTKYMFTDFSYQRMERRIRVPVNIEQLYDCNYVMYQNKNFTNKWFYAFITDLEYANPEMTWVTIETDVFQTWLTEMEWKQSFILREHVEDDTPGNHLVPEDLDFGEYVIDTSYNDIELEDFLIIVATTSTPKANVVGTIYNNIYSGARFFAYETSEVQELNAWLNELDGAGKGDAVSSMFMFPKMFVEYEPNSHVVISNENIVSTFYNMGGQLEQFGPYRPHNNKLFTYPYTFLTISNNNGLNAIYEFEYFDGGVYRENDQWLYRARFEMRGAIGTNPSIFCIPINFKNQQTPAGNPNYNELITLNNYPQCQWSYGSYNNWFAQNSASIQLQNNTIERNMRIDAAQGTANTIVDGISGVIGALTGGGISGIQGAANEGVETYQAYRNSQDAIKQNMINVYQHSIVPNQLRGGTGGMGVNVSMGLQNFFFYKIRIREGYAYKIDKYFDFYGYKVNRFAVPNLESRPHWNYIQTIDCNIEGSFPDEHITKLKSIFNKGITIWHTATEVNNYDLDNGVSTT